MSVFPSGYLGLAKPRSVLTELEEKVFAPCYNINYAQELTFHKLVVCYNNIWQSSYFRKISGIQLDHCKGLQLIGAVNTQIWSWLFTSL